jgi:uncharacterized protein YndB with AHSA1/START domain
MSGDRVKVSVTVRVPQADAFDVFTREIDLWWRKGPQFRIGGRARGQLLFEPGPNGRLFETYDGADGPRTFEVGKITAWQPPSRLEFEWRGVNFEPRERTWVEVTFQSQGENTLVCVVHRGFAALPSDHPVRHGKPDAEFIRMIALWWSELMTSLREHISLQTDCAADSSETK